MHQPVSGQNIDGTKSVTALAGKITDVESRFTEELVGAFALQYQQRALNGTDRG